MEIIYDEPLSEQQYVLYLLPLSSDWTTRAS